MKWFIVFGILFLCSVRVFLFLERRVEYKDGQLLRVNVRVGEVYQDSQFRQFFYIQKIKILVPGGEDVAPGDRIEVVGVFDLERNKIDVKSFVTKEKAPGFLNLVQRVRMGVVSNFLHWLPNNEGALMAGVLVGGSSGMSWNMKEAFRKVGLTHIVAASGYNLSVVAVMVQFAVVPLIGRKHSFYFVLVCVVLYSFLAGLGAPIVRAAIMTAAVFVAVALGRKTSGYWVLFLAASLMIIFDPAYVVSISFQLSTAAMFGVVFSGSVLKTKRTWVKELGTGLIVSLTTMPVSLYHFGQISLLSPFLTFGVSFLLPLVMGIGILALITGSVVPPLGGVVALAAWPILKIITSGVQLFSKV